MSESKKVALPAFLPRRLQAFRIVAGDTTTYLLRDKLTDKTHDIEPWQFFVLEVLPGCETVDKLLAVFEDRFGRPLSEGEVLKFFGTLADRRLLDEESAAHPLLKPFTKQSYALHLGLAKPRTFEELAALMAQTSASIPTVAPTSEKTEQLVEDATLAAGVNEAENLDPRAAGRAWKLFEIRSFLARTLPLVAPLRWLVYVLPFLGLAALIIGVRYSYLIADDLTDLHKATTLFTHALISLFAINILVVMTQAYVAQAFRASVGPLSIGLRFGFFPRFTVRVRHTEQLSRRERMWLHAGPLLMRVFLFSAGLLLWWNTRETFPLLALFGLSIGFLCAVNIVLEGGNPLVKGNGYFLLAAFMNEPHLRGKSYKAVMAKLRGGTAPEADSNVLVAYALANFLYGFVVVAVIVMIVAKFLAHLQIGGTTVILACVLAGYLLVQTVRRFSRISAAYERSVQFDRWRKRALPAEGGDVKQVEAPATSRTTVYVRTAVLLTLLLLLFLPYPYDAGGNFDIYPSDRQVITSDVAGIVEEVNFVGSESVKKGAVIARIASTDLKSQINVLTAKIAEQAAVIKDLQARPKKEEIIVAERALDVAKKREKFSRERVPRMERLYKDRAISFEEYDAARREAEVDIDEVAKRAAELALVKSGVTPDRIAAEKAKLDSLVEERETLNGKVERTTLRMPFDGNILTLHLNERLNSVMDKGQPFATVEDTRSVTAEIQVPESEIGYVVIGASVRAKPASFFDREFVGKVQTIDRNVTVKPFGNVVKVIAVIDNPKGELKTGMTGYAKIGGTTMPVWKAFSLALLRFFNIQVWSWIP